MLPNKKKNNWKKKQLKKRRPNQTINHAKGKYLQNQYILLKRVF